MTNENKNIYWDAACNVNDLHYGVCIVLCRLEGTTMEHSQFAKIFSQYFKPSISEALEYNIDDLYRMQSHDQSCNEDQLDRFVALLLMHEIYNEPYFVEDPNQL